MTFALKTGVLYGLIIGSIKLFYYCIIVCSSNGVSVVGVRFNLISLLVYLSLSLFLRMPLYLFNGFCEEFYFRYVLFNAMKTKGFTKVFIPLVLNSFIYVVFHQWFFKYDSRLIILQGIEHFLFSSMMCLIYNKNMSIFQVSVTHGVTNTIYSSIISVIRTG